MELMINRTVTTQNPWPHTDCDRFQVSARSTRMWHPGDFTADGELIGRTVYGVPVHAATNGRVTQIQYDVETDELILTVEPAEIGTTEQAGRETS